MTEEERILRASQGDTDALEILLRRHQGWIHAVVLRQASADLLRYAPADDIVQHAMTGAFRGIGQFDPGSSPEKNFRDWLAAIAVNSVRAFGRKRSGALKFLESQLTGEPRTRSASKLARARDRRDHLLGLIAKLPDTDRGVIELQLRGFTLEQIAEHLDISKAAANGRIDRARDRLREKLGSKSSVLSST